MNERDGRSHVIHGYACPSHMASAMVTFYPLLNEKTRGANFIPRVLMFILMMIDCSQRQWESIFVLLVSGLQKFVSVYLQAVGG